LLSPVDRTYTCHADNTPMRQPRKGPPLTGGGERNTGQNLFAKGTQGQRDYRRIQGSNRYIVTTTRNSHYRWLKEGAKPRIRILCSWRYGNVYEARVTVRSSTSTPWHDDRGAVWGLSACEGVVAKGRDDVEVHEYAVALKERQVTCTRCFFFCFFFLVPL